MLVLATIAIAIFGLSLTRVFIQILKVPRELLIPVVFTLCVIGRFALTQRMFDIWVMLFSGLVGFVLRRMDYPMSPLVLGIILGTLLDKSLRRGLTLSNGDLSHFFTRPISATFALIIVSTIVLSILAVRRSLTRLNPGLSRPTKFSVTEEQS